MVLFGMPGSDLAVNGALAFGPARLPNELARALDALLSDKKPRLQREDVLNALTSIRRQTQICEQTGAAAENTLRSVRTLRRGLIFHSPIYADVEPDSIQRGLLAACVRAVRHIGTHRARGLGEAQATLWLAEKNVTPEWMAEFQEELS